MEFTVTIDQFDGPLDLMLHLIKEGDLDLFDLDIEKLADQYLAYIQSMQDQHLDVASEYLVTLAALIEFKSRRLLPQPGEELEDDYQGDTPQQLVDRLIEYQRFKEAAGAFEELYQERRVQHDKPESEIASQWESGSESYQQTSPYELIKAMNRCLKRFQMEQPYEVSIEPQPVTVEERTRTLKEKVAAWHGKFTMEQTMADCTSVYMVVVTFLALLDMVQDGALSFTVHHDTVYFSKGAEYE
jgi:segregation and condensation protein A